jgi:hypothetical protein
MPFDPDTEIQYRKGGKIMKKTPRKFSAGGGTEAPKTGMDLELENARKDRFNQQGLENYENKGRKLGPRVSTPSPTPSLPKPGEKPEVKKAKGGKIAKFVGGGDVREGEHSGIDEETRARVRNFLRGDLEEPKTAKPTVRKAAPKTTPRVTPKTAPKKEMTGGGAGSTEPSYAPKNYGERGNMFGERLNKYGERGNMYGGRDGMRFADEVNSDFKKGGKVAKYAKDGGVESKGKTKGKVVKMATGGSVRGYGISKVTNKTKYC